MCCTFVAVVGRRPDSQACEGLCCNLHTWPAQRRRPAARLSLGDSSFHHSEWPLSPGGRTHTNIFFYYIKAQSAAYTWKVNRWINSDLQEEELLSDLLDELLRNILWEELCSELELKGVLLLHILLCHLEKTHTLFMLLYVNTLCSSV